VHLLPGVVDSLPDACFAATCGDRFTVLNFLGEPRVAQYNGLITEPAQMGTRHGDCHRCGCCVGFAGQVEVVAVKGKPFHQVTHTFSLKTADICVAYAAVVLPISRRNAFQHGLVDGEDLSIAFLKGHAICWRLQLLIFSGLKPPQDRSRLQMAVFLDRPSNVVALEGLSIAVHCSVRLGLNGSPVGALA